MPRASSPTKRTSKAKTETKSSAKRESSVAKRESSVSKSKTPSKKKSSTAKSKTPKKETSRPSRAKSRSKSKNKEVSKIESMKEEISDLKKKISDYEEQSKNDVKDLDYLYKVMEDPHMYASAYKKEFNKDVRDILVPGWDKKETPKRNTSPNKERSSRLVGRRGRTESLRPSTTQSRRHTGTGRLHASSRLAFLDSD